MGNCLGRCLSGKSGLRHSTDEQEVGLVPEDPSNERYIFKIMKFKRKKRPQFLDRFWEQKDASYSRMEQTSQPVESSDIQLQCLDAQTLLVSAREFQSTKAFNNNYTELGAASSSRASSSLDLEWEHEYNQSNHLNCSWLFLPEEVSENGENGDNGDEDEGNTTDRLSDRADSQIVLIKQTLPQASSSHKKIARTASKSSWSHISTPESLEWDIDEDQQKQLRVEDDNLDHETLELLHEIEILKNKVLRETGDCLDCGQLDSRS